MCVMSLNFEVGDWAAMLMLCCLNECECVWMQSDCAVIDSTAAVRFVEMSVVLNLLQDKTSKTEETDSEWTGTS